MSLRRAAFASFAFLALVGCTTTTKRIIQQQEASPAEAADGDEEDPSASADDPSSSDDPSAPDAGSSKPKPPAPPPPQKDASAPDGSLPGVDRTACVGPASSSGSIYGTTPSPKNGQVITDPSSGGLRLILAPNVMNIVTNDVVIGLYFTPIPGQKDYSPNGSVGCAVLRYTGSGWAVVDKTQLCELHLSTLQHASAANVCDGTLAGTWNGIFSGNQPLAGTFVLPSNVAASQVKPPSCRPYDSVCSKHSDCCSQSCSPVLGLCQ